MADRDQSLMTPIEVLREAAWQMRERAERATPGPWVTGGGEIYCDVNLDWVGEALQIDDSVQTAANSAYIAGMHPGVALAVADWLDMEARMVELRDNSTEGQTFHALAVARAYLGGDR